MHARASCCAADEPLASDAGASRCCACGGGHGRQAAPEHEQHGVILAMRLFADEQHHIMSAMQSSWQGPGSCVLSTHTSHVARNMTELLHDTEPYNQTCAGKLSPEVAANSRQVLSVFHRTLTSHECSCQLVGMSRADNPARSSQVSCHARQVVTIHLAAEEGRMIMSIFGHLSWERGEEYPAQI